MITIDINDISGYLQRLPVSETVLIVRNGKPVAELKPLAVAPDADTLRPFGLCAGEFMVPDDLDAPLPDALFAGIQQLSVTERIQIVEDIWDTVAAQPELLAITDAQRDELQRRLEVLQPAP